MEEILKEILNKLESMDKRFDKLENRLDLLENKCKDRLDQIENKVSIIEKNQEIHFKEMSNLFTYLDTIASQTKFKKYEIAFGEDEWGMLVACDTPSQAQSLCKAFKMYYKELDQLEIYYQGHLIEKLI